jgi:Xaa-Pro aminopeptidase
VRGLLRDRSLHCLIVGTFRSREAFDSYLTNEHLDSVVVFPAEGEPTALTWNTTHLSRARESAGRGVELWVADCRPGFGGAATAAVVREKGGARGRIGIVGLEATAAGEREGVVPHSFWLNLGRDLPDAAFDDITRPFADLVLVKSEEELALVRYAARVSEAACQVMLAVSRPGVAEDVVYAEIMREVFRHGADVRYPMLSLQSGPETIGWGRPRWIGSAERPRVLARGDMVQAEIHTCYGGQEAQVQMSVALDPVDALNRRAADVARRSYEAGLAAVAPGITVADLVRAMELPLREAGAWAKTPLCHTMSFGATGVTGVGREQIDDTPEAALEPRAPAMRRGDLVLQPGMVVELEPNACFGMHRVNLGAGVIVTPTGAEELNTLPTRVQSV